MNFFDQFQDSVLIEIFKNFDLKTRLKANRMCKKWYLLLKDPRTNMEHVSYVQLNKYSLTEPSLTRIWNDSLSTDYVKIMMNGLRDHIGKTEKFILLENDIQILTRLFEMIETGGLKFNQLSLINQENSNRDAISGLISAITPLSINQLSLNSPTNPQFLVCDWSKFSSLKNLILNNISLDKPTTISLSLKYLRICVCKENCEKSELLITMLSFLPLLEELHISAPDEAHLNFDDQAFSNFLRTIKWRLPNLRSLTLDRIRFVFENIDKLVNEFSVPFFIYTLQEIEFNHCAGDWIKAARLFQCTLKILRLNVRHFSLDIYNFATSIRDNTKLELSITGSIEYGPLRYGTPIEFGRTLSKLYLAWNGWNEADYLRDFFDCKFSYENLIEINFVACQGQSEEILKNIAHLCPQLEKLTIFKGESINKKGLEWFVFYWETRRSERLSITIIGHENIIDGLCGTFFSLQDRGILDKAWTKEEEKEDVNGEPRSKRQKKKLTEKCWRVFRKTFCMDNRKDSCTRLVIWDKINSKDDPNRKLLIIKDYEKDKLDNNVFVKTI